MKILNKLMNLIGIESDSEKVNRYNDLKKSFESVSLKIDELADSFLIEKSLYKKRIQNPDNESIKLRIKEKWDEYLKIHRQEISKAKKEYDSIKGKVENLEKSEVIKKNSQTKSLQIIKKAYQENIISLDDYNKAINKVSKRKKTLYSDFLLFNEKGELLLMKRSTWDTSNPGCWVVPGGHVDPGEDHETAAKRELQEETGYNIEDVINVGSYDDENCHIEYFQGTVQSNTQTPVIQFEEARDLQWIPLSELHEHEMVFNMKENLMKILNLPNQEKTVIRKNILGKFGNDVLDIIEEALKNKKIEKGSDKDYNKLLLQLRERRGELKKEDFLYVWRKLMTSKNSEDKEEYNEYSNRYRLKDITYWPQGLDLENCEVCYIDKEKVIIYAGGDWQKGKYVTITLDQNSRDGDGLGLEVSNISDDCEYEQTKTERNKFRKENGLVKGADILKSHLDNLYLELGQELVKKNRQYNVLIEKGFTEEANNILDEIEKAKKDISRLKKLKKLVYRDGKLIFGTYYVKEEETKEDEEKIGKSGVILTDITEGDEVELSTKKRTIKGIVSGFSFNKKSSEHWMSIITDDDKIEWVNTSSLKSFEKLDKGELEEKTYEDFVFPEYDELTLGKVLGGSSGVKLASDKNLKPYIVKNSHKGDFQQLVNEFEVNNIYRSLGFSVPEQKLDEKNKVLISKYLLGYKELGTADSAKSEKLNEEICKGYVLDALLANWDVIGQSKDNILYNAESRIVRIDNGGSLKFRARGGSKSFGEEVNEIKTLRENSPGNEVYSTITDSDITEQISFLIKNRDKIKVSDSLSESDDINKILQKRIDWLANKYGLSVEEKKEVKIEEKKEVLRSDMPSLVTQKYFDEKYDKLVNINGNKGIKEHIKNHIIKIEKRNEYEYRKIAEKKGITVEELKQDFQQAIEDIVGRSKGYIVAHSSVNKLIRGKEHGVLGAVLSEKRFKTQFETGTSCGALDETYRSRTENGYFGFDEKTEPKNMRPIYGFFTDNKHGAINNKGTVPPPRRVNNYGDICFEIKEEKFRRDSTITFRDSLSSEDEIASTPVSAPHFTSVAPFFYDNIKEMQKGKVGSSEDLDYAYVETQYHGQLTLDDIEKIHISIDSYSDKSNLNKVVNEVIKYTTVGGDPIEVELF